MPELLQFLLSGITVGAVYALVALGFTIIYNASDVVNFAQGEFVMLGGMITVSAYAAGLPLPLAGVLITPITNTSYDVGIALALKGFAAAMLGGMGNPKGALAGGFLIGLIEALTAGYLSSQYKDAAAFVVILLVLFFMPRGLFGGKSTDRV